MKLPYLRVTKARFNGTEITMSLAARDPGRWYEVTLELIEGEWIVVEVEQWRRSGFFLGQPRVLQRMPIGPVRSAVAAYALSQLDRITAELRAKQALEAA